MYCRSNRNRREYMSGEGFAPMSMQVSNRRSLETTAALNRIPLDETEDLAAAVSIGVISEKDAIESIMAEGPRYQGTY
jgi:hypothetical protein